MANGNHGKSGRSIAAGLTAIFMSAVLTAQALAMPQATPAFNKVSCSQEITPETLKDETGFKNFDDFLTASAFAEFMRQQSQNPQVIHAILQASEDVGVDFELMVVKAMLESALGKHDKPLHVNGAARGLYQFLPATWLTLFAWFGKKYENGRYEDLADAIKFDSRGQPYVDDPAIKKQILALRSDHYMAAFIKAAQLKYDEADVLRAMTGRKPTITDYYIVHFLGIPRARVFYRHLKKNPGNPAAAVLHPEARNNHFVFYGDNGKPLSFAAVYKRLEGIIESRLDYLRAASEAVLQGTPCIPPLQRGVTPPMPERLDFSKPLI